VSAAAGGAAQVDDSPSPPIRIQLSSRSQKDGVIETCRDFLKGRCQFKDCKFFHPPTSTEGRDPATGPNTSGASTSTLSLAQSSDEPAPTSRQVCRKFLTGECTAGNACPHEHPASQASTTAAQASPSQTRAVDVDKPLPPSSPALSDASTASGTSKDGTWWNSFSSWNPRNLEDESWASTDTSNSTGPSTPIFAPKSLPTDQPGMAKPRMMVPPQVRGIAELRPVASVAPARSNEKVILPPGTCFDWYRGRCGRRYCQYKHHIPNQRRTVSRC
jgi:hypothetical protein